MWVNDAARETWASVQRGLGLSARDYDLRLVPCRISSALLDGLDPPLLASSSPMIVKGGHLRVLGALQNV